MRYIAEKIKGNDYTISGIKEMELVNGDKAEVIVDTKRYNKKELKETIEAYAAERDGIVEKYNADLKDMQDILDSMGN